MIWIEDFQLSNILPRLAIKTNKKNRWILVDGKILHRLPGERLRSRGWLDGQMILSIMLLNLLGFDHVSDIDRLEDDRVLCRMSIPN